MTRRHAVAVIGPGETEDGELLAVAYDVAKAVAALGHVVVTGGGSGVMAAAARGAHAAGGLVLGLAAGDAAALDGDVGPDVVVPTGMGQGRNVLVVRAADVVVAVGGSWGTLSEVALAHRLGRPVVWCRGWTVTGPVSDDRTVAVTSADEVVEAVARLLPEPG